jgi:tRNA threonylcarbamoyladenosine biosynthesis protein TsaB
LQASDLRLADVNAFAVVSGPGSFTGLRVGLSAVKAMAEATGKPILVLSHLAILTSMAAALYPQESVDRLIHTVLDAGRGELYHGAYRNAGKTCAGEYFQALDALVDSLQSEPGLVVASEPAVRHALEARGILAREIPQATVRDAVPLAVAAWQAGDLHDSADVDANYLRRSDAVVVARVPGAAQPAQRQGREL